METKKSISLKCSLCENTINENEIYYSNREGKNVCENCIVAVDDFLEEKMNESEQSGQEEKLYLKRFKSMKQYTKRDICRVIEKTIIGQESAIYHIVSDIYDNLIEENPCFRKNVLVVGDTGCGKSKTIELISEMLDLPCLITSATDYSETGYEGAEVNDMIEQLYEISGEDPDATERGIIFIDEIDKIMEVSESIKDVSGKGVQDRLLTLMSGRKIPIYTNFDMIEIDTSFITFILAGAFDSIDQESKLSVIRQKRLQGNQKSNIGFSNSSSSKENLDIISNYISQDFEKYGLGRQLVARCMDIVEYNLMSKEIYYQIFQQAENSPYEYCVKKLAREQVTLKITKEEKKLLLQLASKRAENLKIGARACFNIMTDVFSNIFFKLDELTEKGVKPRFCYISHHIFYDHNDFSFK